MHGGQDVMTLSVRLTSVIAAADAALLFRFSSSEQACAADFRDVSWFPVLLGASTLTIIVAYFHICNNNFNLAK